MGSMANTMGGGRGFAPHGLAEEDADGAFTPPERPETTVLSSRRPKRKAPEDADAASDSPQDAQAASGEDNAARPQRPDDNVRTIPRQPARIGRSLCCLARAFWHCSEVYSSRFSSNGDKGRRDYPCACAYGLVVIFADSTVKDISDFLAGGFVEQRDNHAYPACRPRGPAAARRRRSDRTGTGTTKRLSARLLRRLQPRPCSSGAARTARESRPDRTPSRSRPRRFQPCS